MHRVVALDHDVVEQVVGEALAPRSVGSARKDAVNVFAVLRTDVHAALEETRPIQQRDNHDGSLDVRWLEVASEPDGSQDARVLGRVTARGQYNGGPVFCADRRGVGPLILAQV